MHTGDLVRLSIFLLLFGAGSLFNAVMAFRLVFRRNREIGHIERVLRYIFWVLMPFELLCLIYGMTIEPNNIGISSYTLTSEHIAADTEISIAHLTDLHVDTFGRREQKCIRLLRTIAPDMILITGDLINISGGSPHVSEMLSEIEQIAPVYLVGGNVDNYYPVELQKLKDQFTFLQRGSTVVEGIDWRVTLVGTDDGMDKLIPEALGTMNRETDGYRILLNHRPDLAEEAYIGEFDLYLAGHTHGGQIRMPFFGAIITFSRFGKKYEMGMYALEQDTRLYVNRGIGLEGGSWLVPGARFLCPPEIGWFTIKGTGTKHD